MSKIISITLNTAIDRIIEVEHFKKGIVTTAKHSSFYPSGKAINASQTVSSLQEKVEALGFVGEAENSAFQKLNSKFLKMNLTKIEGYTRTNITLIDSNHNLIIHTRTPGFKVVRKHFDLFLSQLKEKLSNHDIVIISGSIPPGLFQNVYVTIISLCHLKGAKVILDTSSKFLKKAIKSKPFAIKPNLEELQELLGRRIKTEKEIVSAAKSINSFGIELVFVSNGSKGVVLTKEGVNGYWKAIVNLNKKKFTGEEIGCGDAFVGALAVSLKRHLSTLELLKLCVASGASNLLTPGPGVCNINDINGLINEVKVEYVSNEVETTV